MDTVSLTANVAIYIYVYVCVYIYIVRTEVCRLSVCYAETNRIDSFANRLNVLAHLCLYAVDSY